MPDGRCQIAAFRKNLPGFQNPAGLLAGCWKLTIDYYCAAILKLPCQTICKLFS